MDHLCIRLCVTVIGLQPKQVIVEHAGCREVAMYCKYEREETLLCSQCSSYVQQLPAKIFEVYLNLYFLL